jgi:hypothetical protein
VSNIDCLPRAKYTYFENAYARSVSPSVQDRLFLMATKFIPAGAELFVNYGSFWAQASRTSRSAGAAGSSTRIDNVPVAEVVSLKLYWFVEAGSVPHSSWTNDRQRQINGWMDFILAREPASVVTLLERGDWLLVHHIEQEDSEGEVLSWIICSEHDEDTNTSKGKGYITIEAYPSHGFDALSATLFQLVKEGLIRSRILLPKPYTLSLPAFPATLSETDTSYVWTLDADPPATVAVTVPITTAVPPVSGGS